jgi:hypothetical protein
MVTSNAQNRCVPQGESAEIPTASIRLKRRGLLLDLRLSIAGEELGKFPLTIQIVMPNL